MFINNINPDLLTIGPFNIRFYGIVYALGFLLVNYVLSKAAENKKIKNLTKERASDLVVWGMVIGLIGARLLHVLLEFNYYFRNPLMIPAIWNGGLAFQGGFAAAILFVYYYCKKHKIKLLDVTDLGALYLPFIIGFGRIANFINSEHLGPISDVGWCVKFIRADYGIVSNVTQQVIDSVPCRHPIQLYQSLSQFMLFGILLLLGKKSKKRGAVTFAFVAGYGLIRFVTDFYRTDMASFMLGLSLTQILGLFMFIIGIYLIKVNKK